MKIVTWNINGIRAVTQKGFYEFWEKENPDILCIQETKAHPDQLQKELVQPKGWNGYWSAAQRPGYSGVATFCKETPESVSYGIGIPKFDAEGRIVITKFKTFTLYNIYFPNGGSGEERHLFKQEFLQRLSRHLKPKVQDGENIIVVGDYNVAYLDIDVYNPKGMQEESGFLPEERKWMIEFLEGGFVDSFRYFHPDEKGRFSWWSYFKNARATNSGWRIDHICVTRSLEKKLKSCQIFEAQEGSDHCPVIAELSL